MTMIEMADGQVVLATSIYLPKVLVERARKLKINRSKIFREALAEEIERITRDEAPKISVEEASHSTSSEANDH